MLERLYRQRVPADASRSEQRLSAETMLRTFEVQGLLVEQTPVGRVVHATHPTRRQRQILDRRGLATPAAYIAQRLAPVPTG